MARAWSVCNVSGCPTLIPTAGRCDECRSTANKKRKNTAHQRSYKSAAWRKFRARFLRENPYCECDDCLELPPIMRPRAEVVDHIDGLGPLGPRGYDETNLRPMTTRCHNKRTAREQSNNWGRE